MRCLGFFFVSSTLLPSFPSFFLFLFLSCGKKVGGAVGVPNLVFSLFSEEKALTPCSGDTVITDRPPLAVEL